MTTQEQVYRDLQRHLNNQPVGFPSTKSGSDLRLLERFFDSNEAFLAMKLSYKPRSLKEIYDEVKKTGISFDDLKNTLNAMADKGVIGEGERNGAQCFFNIPLVVGMYEGQLYGLTREVLKDFDEYTGTRAFGLEFLSSELPQMRTIPVERSIKVEHQVATYDQLTSLIYESDGPFVIHECICRKASGMKGSPCQKTSRLETCMALGDAAKHSVKVRKGREVTREEALSITRQNQADGLVLQPSNSQRAEFICACCGCCCGMLRVQKMLPKPVDFWASNYYATVDAGACTGCGTCVEKCQVKAAALSEKLGISTIDLNRCIGCGNCVPDCPSGAMRLVKKEKGIVPPETRDDLYDVIMAHKKGALAKIRLATRLMLKK
jgi:electron transport complex protein RnfB